jgi:phage protein D
MPDPGAAPATYSARPRIQVGGQEQPALAQQLQTLFVEETVAGLYRCEASFLNWGPRNGRVGFLYFDRDVLDFGQDLVIEMGAGDGAGTIFEGRVMALEGRFTNARPPELLVLAEDRLQDLRMTRRTRTFEDVTDADVIRQVASAHGLQADIDASGPTHRVVAQVNQSDLAFARDRAQAVGAELWVEGGGLNVKTRSARAGSTVTLTYGAGLRELVVTADLAHQATGFRVAGWDASSKQAVSHRATDTAIASELDGGEAGGRLLESALGPRDQQLVHALPVSDAEARALAEACYSRVARRFVVGEGVAEGDARLRVGAVVELADVGPLFSGEYVIARVRHTFDTIHGYRTAFTAERPAVGRAA